jgi:hypothetical protein
LSAKKDVGIFDPGLFEKIANSGNRIPVESIREAWLADTILLLGNTLSANAVLSGGSAVRNLTRVMRLTYDIDFDTRIDSIEELRGILKAANRRIRVSKRKENGCVYEDPHHSNDQSFYGERRIFHALRRTSSGELRIHIMHVPDMPEMFESPLRLQLVSVEDTERTVRNARAEHLFFRKSLRASRERRVEDFLDLYSLIVVAGSKGKRKLVEFAKAKDASSASSGLEILSRSAEYFAPQLRPRLTYVEPDLSASRLNEIAYSIAKELEKAATEIKS